MKRKFLLWCSALLLLASLLCASCGKVEASTIRLKKTEGAVSVSDDKNVSVEPQENLMLYSGYGMLTQARSYAWVDLDEVKLAKLDENTGIEIQKDGKKLEIQVSEGSLFFNITQPLAEDETMDISTSSMTVGIRGTCGWVVADGAAHSQVYILEGTVSVSSPASSERIQVTSGQMADVTIDDSGEAQILVEEFFVDEIPEFIRTEIESEEELLAEIPVSSTPDEPTTADAPSTEEAEEPDEPEPSDAQRAREAYDNVIAEYLDAEQNALPCDVYSLNYTGDSEEEREAYQEEMDRNYQANKTNYPLVADMYWEFYMDTPLYHAYYDLDGNGIEELFIGLYSNDRMQLLEAYAFNGSEAVMLSFFDESDHSYFDTYFGVITADGLFISGGNGGIGGEFMYRLSEDGYSLERVEDNSLSISPDSMWYYDLDLSAYGGAVNDAADWSPLEGSASIPYFSLSVRYLI